MKRTLYLKFLLGFLIFGILGFLTVSTFSTRRLYRYLQTAEADSLYREAKAIATGYAANYYQDTLTLKDMEEQLSAVGTYLNASIWIVDPQGKLLSGTGSEISTPSLTQIADFDIASFGTRYSQTGYFFDTLEEKSLTVYSPININYRVRGYVLIHKPLSQIMRYRDGLVNIIYLSLAIIFLCALVIVGIFTFLVYLPVRKITRAADAYAAGNFDVKLHIHSNDELGYMAASLNYMASELNALEENQRKFIANVSHDFRSPLTSIKGYIEAILDGTIPHEMQDKYLNIILLETERLNKLTQNMLELNKYGSHGAILDISDFDINHVIKMTAQSFEGTCIKKRLSFALILSGKELYVTADMGKIQQVLYNLIENAVKFSHEGSTITIETTERNEKGFLSVKDTGIGIPKDSLKKIWERFYKTDPSRGKDKKGTGLGLSIVKEIVQAHNENINVISTEGVGTEFIFTLPLSKK